jgi:peptidoglycan/xylan/chitin deacetylase (PgdA/CDA1 family)
MKMTTQAKSRFSAILFRAILLAALLFLDLFSTGSPTPRVSPAAAQNETAVLNFQIDRSKVPALTYRDLTLLIDIGHQEPLSVVVDGVPEDYSFNLDTGVLIVTTSGEQLTISVERALAELPGFGRVQKAVLKNDKHWAWSHSFDDNQYIETDAVAAFREKGWAATVYMICNIVDDDRDEDWIVDAIDLQQLVQEGWGIGNHTWSHNYADDAAWAEQDIIRCQDRLREVISPVEPEYKISSFAAPMFDSQYHPIILKLRDQNPAIELLFNESGDNWFLEVEPGVFNYDAPIGRDWRVELAGTGHGEDILPKLEAMIETLSEENHVWYNTFTHATDNRPEQGLFPFVDFVYDRYGPGGTDEVWVAPAEEIYSYLLIRDHSRVTLNEISIFSDVPPDHPYHDQIELLYQNGYVAGCNPDPLAYCPDAAMTRAEGAVFIVRGVHGVEFTPDTPPEDFFADLSRLSWAGNWAEQLFMDGYTAGCESDPLMFCPWHVLTRLEGAVFFLRMQHGADYLPPQSSALFNDLDPGSWGAKWAEAAYQAGLIPACIEKPLSYCPDETLSRGLAAYMMVQAKGLFEE